MDNFNNYIPEGTDNSLNYDADTRLGEAYSNYAASNYPLEQEGQAYNEQPYAPAYETPNFEQAPYMQPEYIQPEYSHQSYTHSEYTEPTSDNTGYETSEGFQGYQQPNTIFQNFNETSPSANDFETFEYTETDFAETKTEKETQSKDFVGESLFEPLYPNGYVPDANPQSSIRKNPEDDELTEAELADIRRQKAAARRKKIAARERRRRERRKQAIIRCSILLAIVILLIVGFVALVSGIVKSAKEKKRERELSEYYATSEVTTEEPVADIDDDIIAKELPTDRDAALTILQEQAADDSTMQSICDSAAAMPDILLQHLAVNPEMKDFTLSYPAMINIVFDGEFELEVTKGEVPLYLQFDKRWGYADYSEDIIALRGAGPTALSMAYTYLMEDGSKNPIKVADFATEMGYLDENGKTHWTLMTSGAEGLGLKATEIDTNKEDMIAALEDGGVLICKVKDGDFTTEESFILIHDYKRGFFYLNDPCSEARSQEGWDFKRLRGQIEKIVVLEAGVGEASTADTSNADNANDTNNGDSSADSNDTSSEGAQDDDQVMGDGATE